jgi:hypothetical protein
MRTLLACTGYVGLTFDDGPSGDHTPALLDALRRNGFRATMFDQGQNARLTDGQVVLMHEWPANTLAASPRIAQVLAGRGLCAGMISPQTGRAVAPT